MSQYGVLRAWSVKSTFLLQSAQLGTKQHKNTVCHYFFLGGGGGVIQFKDQKSPHSQQKNNVF